jgi:hypothetical protein
LLITSIWEIKLYTPNNIKTTKTPIIVSFNDRNKEYRYFRLGAISHSFYSKTLLWPWNE